jgi:TnpA family transposase
MKRVWPLDELIEQFTLLPNELELLGNKTGATRLGFAVLLKYFQHEGRFPTRKSDVPRAVVVFIAKQVDVPASAYASYDWSGRSATYHRQHIRTFFGFREVTLEDEAELVAWLAAQPEAADMRLDGMIDLAYARLRACAIAAPTPDRMARLVRTALQTAEDRFVQHVLRHLPADVQAHLDALLLPPPSDAPDTHGNGVPGSSEMGASAVSSAFATAPFVSWYHLKADPGPVSLESLRFEISKLQRLRAVGLPHDLFAQTPPAVLRRYRLRAGAEKTAELKRHPRALRLTLLAVMVWQRQMEITDTIVDVLLGMLHRTEIRAEKRVKQELLGDIVRVDGKQALLVRIAEAALNDPTGQVAQVVFPAAGGKERLQQIVKEATSGAVFRQTVQIRVRRSYQAHLRQLLGPVLRTLTFRCNNDRYRPLLQAIQVLRDHLDYGGAWYPTDVVVPLEGIVPTTLRPVVVEEDEHGGIRINRINYELCVLQALYAKLRCKEIWVEGADTYRNPEDDLPQDFIAQRTAYYEALRQPLDADTLIAQQQDDLRAALQLFNDGLPQNPDVTLRPTGSKRIRLSPVPKQDEPPTLRALQAEITRRWGMLRLLDVVKETELQVGFTALFQSVTAWENLDRADLQQRLLLCLYGIGTNIGLKRVCAGVPTISADQVAYVQQRFVQRDALRRAIIAVVNQTFALRQSDIWGETTTACASDSKKFGAWDQNLLTEWHVRYRGPGIMIYWHVEKRSVCIYSQLKTCSSSEVAAMIQGVLHHCTTMEVSRQYVDSHGQSVVAFAFAHLLNFSLLPRLKAIPTQRLYRVEAGDMDAYPHLQAVLSRPINWELIRQQYDELIKYATALRLGTAEAEAILARFSQNTQHATYRALSELGKARKTIFLCHYLHSRTLRQEIHEGLNVVEAWNRANTFIFYGKGNVFATNSLAQQETAMLCLHLLQACLVFINTQLIQEVLADPAWRDRMTDADWRGLTPLFFSTVTPYGDFVLDMTRRIPLKTPVEATG